MAKEGGPRGATEWLVVEDSETGEAVELPIEEGNAIRATGLRGFKKGPGLLMLDPGYRSTACCTSAVTHVDRQKGDLFYRGYSIAELVDRSSFEETAFLLLFGDLPTSEQFSQFRRGLAEHTYLHQNLAELIATFRYDSMPMGMLVSSMAAMSTFYPEASPALRQRPGLYQEDPAVRTTQIYRILGKMPTVAAYIYRHRLGLPFTPPGHQMGLVENFLYMMDRRADEPYVPNPVLVDVLDKLFIVLADQELSCPTATMRQVGSSLTDPYTAIAAAAGALYGPLGGAPNDSLIQMLGEIGTAGRIPEYLARVKAKECVLWGFGSPTYRGIPDPRARICRDLCDRLFTVIEKRPLVLVALQLEEAARQDPYFQNRKLYPNVYFYTGLLFYSMGFPSDFFPLLFAIPRAVGWLAHWIEGILEPKARIYRPRQIYTGPPEREIPANHVTSSGMKLSENRMSDRPVREMASIGALDGVTLTSSSIHLVRKV